MARIIVFCLFLASCLLAVVSFYTTQQGMALYLSPWFATLAALGIQTALVMTAWLVGVQRQSRPLLIAVYAVTGLVSIAFSYVSLYNWFAARERPGLVRRALYDELQGIAGKTDGTLSEASAKARMYVTAIEEMAAAERAHGHVSRVGDPDPYLNAVREAVAKEAAGVGGAYREGSGGGVRYTAFERYAKLARQSAAEIEGSRRALAAARSEVRPGMASEEQLRRFRAVYDAIPWSTAEQVMGAGKLTPASLPSLAGYVDKAASDQEDLMRAFEELFRAPTSRHVFSLALATFIDIVVFLLAFGAGPHARGAMEQVWARAGASIDAADDQVFVRGLLEKVRPGPGGMARVRSADLSAGEQQLCLALAARGKALAEGEGVELWYVIDREVHEAWMESVAERGLGMRARTARRAAAGA